MLTTNPSTTETTPQFSPQERTPDKLIFTLIIILLLVITGVLGFQNYQLRLSIQLDQKTLTNTDTNLTPTLPPDKPAISDQTNEQKTYTNEEFKFSFKHPASWAYNENPIKQISFPGSASYVIDTNISPFVFGNDMEILISIWNNPNKLSVTEWLTEHEKEIDSTKDKVDFVTNTQVDGLPAYKDLRNWNLSKRTRIYAVPLIDYFVAKKDKIFRIEMNNIDTNKICAGKPVNCDELLDTFDQIVSTFKFLE